MGEHTFEAELYAVGEDVGSWVFVDLPPHLSDTIDEELTSPPRGFGSVRVEVTLGPTTWRTSLFPSKRAGTYVLPVKKAVRRDADVEPGDLASFGLRVVD